ncbi:MAG: hypothetical protein ACOY3Z_01975 [Thermodesulfobacteriota bacterium]
MQRILTAQAAPGMVLAKEVLTPEGRVLCGKGTELSDALIGRLRQMEIMDVTVEGHPIHVEGEKPLKELLAEVDYRFSKVEDVAPLMYLKKRIKERIAGISPHPHPQPPQPASPPAEPA